MARGSYGSGWCVEENTGRFSGTCVCRCKSNGMGSPQREGLVSVCLSRAPQTELDKATYSQGLILPHIFLHSSPCKMVSQGPGKGLHWPHSPRHADCAALLWQETWLGAVQPPLLSPLER